MWVHEYLLEDAYGRALAFDEVASAFEQAFAAVWTGKAAFVAWTESEAFREAHRSAGDARGVYRGHPIFEGFEVVSRLLPQGSEAA